MSLNDISTKSFVIVGRHDHPDDPKEFIYAARLEGLSCNRDGKEIHFYSECNVCDGDNYNIEYDGPDETKVDCYLCDKGVVEVIPDDLNLFNDLMIGEAGDGVKLNEYGLYTAYFEMLGQEVSAAKEADSADKVKETEGGVAA